LAPQVANSYCDWLQDTSLLVSERWPALEGGVRLDVRCGRRARLPEPSRVGALTSPWARLAWALRR